MDQLSESSCIDRGQVATWQDAFCRNQAGIVTCQALWQNDLERVIRNPQRLNQLNHYYSNKLEFEAPATNQKQTGRCWMFAALNVLRLPLMARYKLDNFEFSQAHLLFWDKLEKSNHFLESILATADQALDSQVVLWLLDNVVVDGGQWHMFINLVNKYGLMPQQNYQEGHQSSSTRSLNLLLIAKLKEFACQLRQQVGASGLKAARHTKQQMLAEIFNLLCLFLTPPPTTFDWQYQDKSKRHHKVAQLTPLSFYQQFVACDLDDWICLIHAPTQDKPYQKLYTVAHLGNVVEGAPVAYVNVPIEVMKQATIKALKAQQAVWFGCDFKRDLSRDLGIMDPALFNYEAVLQTNLNLSKAERLQMRDSQMTHAMVFTGVDHCGTRIHKWRVENSHGCHKGDAGYLLMSDAWYDEFVFEIALPKRFVPKQWVQVLDQVPTVLPPWDPFGALAVGSW